MSGHVGQGDEGDTEFNASLSRMLAEDVRWMAQRIDVPVVYSEPPFPGSRYMKILKRAAEDWMTGLEKELDE